MSGNHKSRNANHHGVDKNAPPFFKQAIAGSRCIHARKPGGTAHCSNEQRTDLERAYGFLKVFPQDAGLSCRYWERRYD